MHIRILQSIRLTAALDPKIEFPNIYGTVLILIQISLICTVF
jgi:hypothetical protein